ncbi:hypothetical protein PAMP_001661 [Pampus punctatissimus]
MLRHLHAPVFSRKQSTGEGQGYGSMSLERDSDLSVTIFFIKICLTETVNDDLHGATLAGVLL